jgi:glucose-6-phosphate isomerase
MAIHLDITNLLPFIREAEYTQFSPLVKTAHQILTDRRGAGNDFLGWLDYADTIDPILSDIEATAMELQSQCDVCIVIGIGGSYLGAKAVLDAMLGREVPERKPGTPEILFAGHHMSARQTIRLLNYVADRDICVNVISKSGTTTEPGIAFRLVLDHMIKRYGEAAYSRIVATTDASKGALRQLANQKGLKTFVIPDDIGGRFSVVTPVGLLPMAVAGLDVKAFVDGFRRGMHTYGHNANPHKNPALFYPMARHLLLQKGKTIEILANFEPDLHNIGEWWKQLYGESEGKDGKGIFPAAANFSTDLHSLGQFIQDGSRNLFETFLMVKKTGKALAIPGNSDNLDKLNYLTAMHLAEINEKAWKGTAEAHTDGGVPNMTIWLDALDEAHLAELMYFFATGIAVSGYLFGANPFDQPGVEAYKQNMFRQLGKPGFEKTGQTEMKVVTIP